MDATFEITVARQHRAGHQITLTNRIADRHRQWAGIADAGGATIADGVEAERIEVRRETGLVEVGGDHQRAGRQAGLDPRLDLEAELIGLLGEDASADHDRRIGSIGARSNRRDHYCTVLHFDVVAVDRNRGGATGRAGGGVDFKLLEIGGLDGSQINAVLRTLRARESGYHAAHVEFHGVGVDRFRAGCVAPQAGGLGIGFDQGDLLGTATRELEVRDGFRVDRKDAAGCAVFRRHIGQCRAIGQWQLIETRTEELDKLADHALLAQHLGHAQHQIGGSGAFRQLAIEFEADGLRDQHGDWLTEHGGLGFDAPHAPAQHTQAVDHGGMRIGADHGIGVGLQHTAVFTGKHRAGEKFQIDLMHDAGVGRHDHEVRERFLAPAQEAIAFLIAVELNLGVLVGRGLGAKHIDLHGVVDDEFRRRQRIDLVGVAAQGRHRVAHRRQIDHCRHAGEILHQHARGGEGDFLARGGLGVPLGERLDIVTGDVHPVFGTQQVFEQDFLCERQLGDGIFACQARAAVDLVSLVAKLKFRAGVKRVVHGVSVQL